MKRHIANARRQLGSLHQLAGETEAAERRILDRAEARLAEVQEMIGRLRPGVEAAPQASQDRYVSLVEESGQLQTVIGKARAALGM